MNIVYDFDEANENSYIRGTDLYVINTNGIKSYYISNGHGDITNFMNERFERISKSYAYDAFGNHESSKEDINPFRYCGEYYDEESGLIYLRNRYYDPEIGRFITEDPAKDGNNWYTYCGNNPVMFVDPDGLEEIVVCGGAYHVGQGEYQFEFIDSALLQISKMTDATLLVANAGWTDLQYNAIAQAARERNINLLWFSTIDSLTNYINNGRNRKEDPITSFYVFTHGTDSGTGEYALTFGLYTNRDEQLRMNTKDISNINPSVFSGDAKSYFYSCRTGNDFKNGNFARSWAWITGSITMAFSGTNGRTQYGDILGGPIESRVKSTKWLNWSKSRGDVISRPGEAYQLPTGSYLSSMKKFSPLKISAPKR